jgi:hypothetical protein
VKIAQIPMNAAIPWLEDSCSGIKSAIVLSCDSTVNVTATIIIIIKSFLLSNPDTDNADGNVSGILFPVFPLYLTVIQPNKNSLTLSVKYTIHSSHVVIIPHTYDL